MTTLEGALAELATAEKNHRMSGELLHAAAERVRVLAEETLEASRRPPQTPQGGLVRLTDFARSRTWPSLRTLRRWTSEGEPPPGFVEAGCVRTIGRAVLIDPVVFDEWAKGKIQTPEKRGKGRPRRVI